MTGKKILIIDDDTSIAQGLELLLGSEGYDMFVVTNGLEAAMQTRALLPDLIILDVMLGCADGRDIARSLKADDETKHIPIIMVSANHLLGEHYRECGANVFIPKPF